MSLRCVLAFMILLHSSLFSQTEKGSFLVGGSANLSLNTSQTTSSSNSAFNFSVSPTAAFFFAKNLAVGGLLTLGVSTDRIQQNIVLTNEIGPLVRYYVGKKPQKKVFFQLAGTYANSTTLHNGSIANTENYSGQVAVGFTFFITNAVSIEPIFDYKIRRYLRTDHLVQSRIGIGVGFQFYVPKNIPKS